MPRNVSRSPHELAACTLRFIFTPRASAQGAGRILADRIESKANSILNRKGPLRNQRPFFFLRWSEWGRSFRTYLPSRQRIQLHFRHRKILAVIRNQRAAAFNRDGSNNRVVKRQSASLPRPTALQLTRNSRVR